MKQRNSFIKTQLIHPENPINPQNHAQKLLQNRMAEPSETKIQYNYQCIRAFNRNGDLYAVIAVY